VHRIRHTARKVVGLPDQEFEKMLRRAVELWGEYPAPVREALDAAARERPAYPHPDMASVLDSTFGQVLYAVMWTFASGRR
jgi:hypothetical protein